jgi:hypothetical protein
MLGRLLTPSPRFVLTIGNEGGLLAHVVAGRVTDVLQVGADKAALATLGAALAKRPARPLVVLIDLLEQSYRQETVPKVNRMDRQKVLNRRLERAFPDAELRAALERGDDPDQRSTKRFLLAAVPPGSDWTRWAEFLRGLDNPIVALTLLPVEAVSMVARLARHLTPADAEPNPWTIFICRQATGGVRQIVVNRSELALTRLTPTLAAGSGGPGQGPGAIDPVVATQHELRATLGYMTRLGYRADAGVDIIVLGDDALKRHWHDAIPNGSKLHLVTASDAADALGLGRIPDADHGTLLCGAWAARRRQPAVQLLPHDLRMRMMQTLGLRWANAGLAASAVGLAGYAALSAAAGVELEHEVAWLDAWQTTVESNLERDDTGTSAGTSNDTPSAAALRSVLEAHRLLQADKLDPIASLGALRAAMAPEEELTGLGWQTDSVDDRERRGRGAEPDSRESNDFVLDVTLDLGQAGNAGTAVETADRFAGRLEDGFPDRPILIKRQAVSILPNESFIGGAGLVREPASTVTEMSAEIRIGRRRP